MMSRPVRLGLIIVLCFFVCAGVSAGPADYCSHFEFPGLPADGTVTADQDQLVTIPFRLVINPNSASVHRINCSAIDRIFILVTKVGKGIARHQLDQCTLRVMARGGCMSYTGDDPCRCTGQYGGVFEKAVNVNDSGTWMWWTHHRLSPKREVVFSIQETTTIFTTTTTTKGSNSMRQPTQGEISTSWDSSGQATIETPADTNTMGKALEDDAERSLLTTAANPNRPSDNNHDFRALYIALTIVSICVNVIVLSRILWNRKKASSKSVEEPRACAGDGEGRETEKLEVGYVVRTGNYTYLPDNNDNDCSACSIYEEIPFKTRNLKTGDNSIYLTPRTG